MSAPPKIARIWRIEDTVLQLGFHPGQIEAWNATERFIAVLAGSQGGKTSWAPWWLAREIEATADADGVLNDYIAVTSTYTLFRNKFLPSLLEVFEQVLQTGRYWPSINVIELADPRDGRFWAKRKDSPMWGRILLASASSPSGIESATARGGLADEAGQEEYTASVFDAMERRLQLAQGRLCLPTTPYDLGELKRRYYDPWERRGTPHEQPTDADYRVVQFDNLLNPAYPIEEYRRQKATLPDWKFQMFCRGRFTRPAGQILGCWRGHSHLEKDAAGKLGHEVKNPPDTYPAHWYRIVGLDFGGANTAAGVHVLEEDDAFLPTGRVIVPRTYQGSGGHAPDHMEHIKLAVGATGGAGTYIALAVGGAPSEDQWRQGYRSAGMPVYAPSIADVETGIDRMFGLIATDNLLVHTTERGGDPAQNGALIDQIENYTRKIDDSGEPTHEIKDKQKFHKVDTLRYASCLLAPWHDKAFRFLPYEAARTVEGKRAAWHLVVRPTSAIWVRKFGSLIWREGEPSCFVLGTIDDVGQIIAYSELTALTTESAGEFALRIQRLLHTLKVPLNEDTGKFSITITANKELFVSASNRGITAQPLSRTFQAEKLPLTPVTDVEGESEWAALRGALQGTLIPSAFLRPPTNPGEMRPREAQLRVSRFGAPMCALSLALLQPDPKDPAQPHKNCPSVWAECLAQALRVRPKAAPRPQQQGPLDNWNPLATPAPVAGEIR